MKTSLKSQKHQDQLMFSWEVPPVRVSPSAACDEVLLTRAVTWPSNFWHWLKEFKPSGFYGKTSWESSVQRAEMPLQPSSTSWGNAGMGGPTECWTLNSLESPSVAVGSSLSDIVETGDHLQQYCLSQTAARGLVARAIRWGKTTEIHPVIFQRLQNAC